ncbi:hypothetical protein GGX14DRAFT_473966 [Mycena pura]|uniref:F-box domain-containing protein n=1 Tax=Mycena pura TaxID=153505 RepID=A0AAD6V2X7_9AGAR|nr:hypothetical protein GGX14DRAFT_473966 [Mycena pura]
MGQYWKIINLDKRESHALGKLGESFFYGYPSECLNSSLECLEPTFLPDTAKRYRPGEILSPAPSLARRNHPALYFAKTALRSPEPATLVNLPVEIIHEIHSHMDGFHDLFFFSVTCQVLWEIGRGEMHRRVVKLASTHSWAGDRIICVGDYLRNDDIPASLLSAEEKKDFLVTREENDDEDENDDDEECRLYHYPWTEIHYSPLPRKDVALDRLSDRCDTYLDDLDEQVVSQLCDFKSLKQPALRVLRNFTRQQYVRESAILDLQNEYDHIGFGEVVLSRICLSSDPSTNMAGDIHRGVWAGDRFDVVSAEWLVTDAAGGWTDVSNEVLKEVEAIWKYQYGCISHACCE